MEDDVAMRWIVDAMNVVGSRPDGWWKDRRGALVTLVGGLEGWAGATGNDVTVVLEQPMSPPLQSAVIDVTHAPRAAANSADDEIVRLVRAASTPQDITVVTSDVALASRVQQAGATTLSAGRFRDLLD
jgi:predicted RNA-binding protein with PIN domain